MSERAGSADVPVGPIKKGHDETLPEQATHDSLFKAGENTRSRVKDGASPQSKAGEDASVPISAISLHTNGDVGAPAPVPKWHSRGYLPHRDRLGLLQSITFRLADSLPQKKLAQLREELRVLPEERRSVEERKRIEAWLDAGSGCCALRHPAVARYVEDSLLHFDGERYALLAWCIMPNHVHV